MKIGELARKVGIAPSAIRYYEQVGLVDPPSRVSGQRRYAPNSVRILRFIQLAKAGGFTIDEIKILVDGYPYTKPAEQWHALAKKKKLEIRRKIAELQQIDAVLDALLTCECATINECVDRAQQNR